MTTTTVRHCHRERATARRRSVRAAVLACVVLDLVGCAINPQSPPEAPRAPTYRIGPPDQLEIIVYPEPLIERVVTVRPDGRISFDLIGDVDATGRTPDDVALEIAERISRFKREARVTVKLALSRTDSITIFGEVRVPGAFTLERDTRLAEAIGLRGGPTTFARKGRVRVIRVLDGRTEVHIADIGAIQRGDLTTNIMLEKGDIIVVPPNILARVGYLIQNVVFPFSTMIAPALSAASLATGF